MLLGVKLSASKKVSKWKPYKCDEEYLLCHAKSSFCSWNIYIFCNGKNVPSMDIITSTESCALDIDHNHKDNDTETLRQNVEIFYERT